MREVKIFEKNIVYRDLFQIEEAWLQHEKFDGTMSGRIRRLNFERGDSVAAIVYNRDSEKVILSNQFRYPTFQKGPGWMIEAVAGIKKDNELAEDAIKREILEELGFSIIDLEEIFTFYVSPGGSSERIILFYVVVSDENKIQPGGGVSTEHEDIQIVEMSRDELKCACESNQIQDAKTLIGAQFFLTKK